MNLTNDELVKLLNIPSVGEDLQKRLKNDFKYDGTKPRFIELEEEDITSNNPLLKGVIVLKELEVGRWQDSRDGEVSLYG